MLEILMAFAPLIFLIVYALKTRRMAESMVLATLLSDLVYKLVDPKITFE